MKTCKGPCGKPKDLSEFAKKTSNKDGLQDECKECRNAYNAKWRKEHPKKKRAHQLRLKYDLSVGDYNKMFIKQRGLCDICGHPESQLTKAGKPQWLCVDHSHASGNVRGLLCGSCNRAIGLLKDDTELLKGAIAYLNKHNKP